MLKKSFLTSHNFIIPSTINTSSSQQRQLRLQQRRCFHTSPPFRVMVSQGHSKNEHDASLHWPEVTSASGIPTPYQIFNQRKGSPYSKRRFYELVKLYHPDRHSLESSPISKNELPHTVKLERYRLVVAANDLLSDPIKRGAYDMYGAGWNGQAGIESAAQHGSWASSSRKKEGWEYEAHGPWQNATWEDWEAWRNPKEKQTPQFMSNSIFVILILFFATLGGIGQRARVEDFSKKLVVEGNASHDRASKELMKARRESRNLSNRDERVWKFLRIRNEGLVGTEEEFKRFLVDVPEPPSTDEDGDEKDT